MPLVSVVMAVYNGEKFVAEAIESILQQTLTDLELLIVDDGSTDGTLEIVQDYAARDDRIRVFAHPENRGQPSALNTAIAHAAGKYITLMDSDDVSLPQRLEKQADFLEAHPEIGAVGLSLQVVHEDLTPDRSYQLPERHHAIVLHFLLATKIVIKCAIMMVRREYFDSQPVYDPGIAYGNDVKLFLRLLWEKRIRFANIDDQLYLYRRHDHTLGRRHQPELREIIVHMRRPALRQLGAAGAGVEWIIQRYPLTKLSWIERRQARRDIARLIEAMLAHDWVDAADVPLLHVEMRQLLESTAPRRWQMFLHWYRYRIARRIQRSA